LAQGLHGTHRFYLFVGVVAFYKVLVYDFYRTWAKWAKFENFEDFWKSPDEKHKPKFERWTKKAEIQTKNGRNLNNFRNSAEQNYIIETYLTAGYSWQMKCNKIS
jgi:hypothetical protein